MGRLTIITSEPEFVEKLSGAVGAEHQRDIESMSEINIDQLVTHDPMVVSIGPGFSDDELIAAVGEIDRRNPEISVVLIGEPTPQLWERALRAGARDLLATTAGQEQLEDTFKRAFGRSLRQRDNLLASASDQRPNAETGPTNRVVAVVSPKGGAGKTMLATNLAFGLAQIDPSDVVLVDLDLQFGDIGSALPNNAEYHMGNAAGVAFDSVQLKALLTAHPSGFWTLAAPPTPAEADDIDPVAVAGVLTTLAAEFKWLILDTAAGINEQTLTAIEMATDVFLVTTTDVSSIQSVRKTVDVLVQLGITQSIQTVILNRANAKVGISVDDIERTIGRQVQLRIPSARIVPTTMNQGIPVLEAHARTQVGRALQSIVDSLISRQRNTADNANNQKTQKRWWGGRS